jgi:ribosomal protein S18 acetylase RimI-like enzyme
MMRQHQSDGRSDMVPTEAMLRGILSHIDTELQSRVVEDGSALVSSVLVTSRPSSEGVIARVLAAGRTQSAYLGAIGWGVGAAQATGADVVQVFIRKGGSSGLERFDMRFARPWLRMDRSLAGDLPEAVPVPGYELIDATVPPPTSWSELLNRSFADHWRFVPKSDEETVGDKAPELCLMALTATERSPAAITLCDIADFADRSRPQPVGLVGWVGTAPEHRRRGLASWLVAESLRRMQRGGARHASLYVDGASNTRAYDVYRKLGFEVAYEAEVWEATSS